MPDELAFTSKEVIAIINGGCLCTIGRGTCQLHATSHSAVHDQSADDQPRELIPE